MMKNDLKKISPIKLCSAKVRASRVLIKNVTLFLRHWWNKKLRPSRDPRVVRLILAITIKHVAVPN